MQQMQLNYCSQCGYSLQPNSKYCSSCGAVAEPQVRYLISVPRIILLSILSGGLYLFWWFYITWKQYRDHTGEKAFPVWHALTLIVPIYSLFRVHAHIRSFKELMTARQVVSSLSPWTAVGAIFVSNFLTTIGITEGWFGEISKAWAIWFLTQALIITIITVWLLAAVQTNINRYWRSVLPRASSCRIGIGEVIFTLVGIVVWIDVIATALSDSWRTW